MTDVATLDARVKVLRAGSFAESTKRTYSTYLTCYLRFCGKLDINPVPLSTSNLGRYIAYLSLKLKFNSITNYLTVIKHLHVEAGLENPVGPTMPLHLFDPAWHSQGFGTGCKE